MENVLVRMALRQVLKQGRYPYPVNGYVLTSPGMEEIPSATRSESDPNAQSAERVRYA